MASLLIVSAKCVYAQRTITGTVVDKDKQPVPGVNVIITGTGLGSITNVDGRYSIEAPQDAKSLTFTFIGMETQEVAIGTQTQINVSLVEAVTSLEEVVVVGYGVQKKVNLTGAVGTVDYDEFYRSPGAECYAGASGSCQWFKYCHRSWRGYARCSANH